MKEIFSSYLFTGSIVSPLPLPWLFLHPSPTTHCMCDNLAQIEILVKTRIIRTNSEDHSEFELDRANCIIFSQSPKVVFLTNCAFPLNTFVLVALYCHQKKSRANALFFLQALLETL